MGAKAPARCTQDSHSAWETEAVHSRGAAHRSDLGYDTIAIVCSAGTGGVNGIRDHSLRLVEALRKTDSLKVDLFLQSRTGGWIRFREQGVTEEAGPGRLPADLDAYDTAILQYNPFLLARRGFAPWLIPAMLRLRGRVTLALIVHERWPPPRNWRWMLMGAWQRLQLMGARWCANVMLVTIEDWTKRMGRALPHRPTHHLPVGSNLPDMRSKRDESRRQLGAQPQDIVLACLLSDRPEYDTRAVSAAASAIADSGAVMLLRLGATAPPLGSLDRRIFELAPGCLQDSELARLLAASDIFLAPYADGATTRRGSLMAGLQHGLPVVTTVGPRTDGMLRDASDAMCLVPVGARQRFVEATQALASDRDRRLSLGSSARALYEREFAWDVLATELLQALRGVSADS